MLEMHMYLWCIYVHCMYVWCVWYLCVVHVYGVYMYSVCMYVCGVLGQGLSLNLELKLAASKP